MLTLHSCTLIKKLANFTFHAVLTLHSLHSKKKVGKLGLDKPDVLMRGGAVENVPLDDLEHETGKFESRSSEVGRH